MIRVLMITVARMDRGGIESYLMSLLRNIDREKIHFDYLVHRPDVVGCYEEEIYSLGCKVYKLPRMRYHPIKYFIELNKILKEGNYDIVHRHSNSSTMWTELWCAKRAGINVRIAHSHNSSWDFPWLHKLGIPFLNMVATGRLACSEDAGRWMFGKRKFLVAKNGINIDNYKFDNSVRQEYRKRLGIEGKAVLNVGRLVAEKNQTWLLNLAKSIKSQGRAKDIHFYIAGEGPLKGELEQQIVQQGLTNMVHLLGQRDDIPQVMMASDVMVLPSLYEGMGIVLAEAQCTGLRCIVADNLPREADVGRCKFIPLDTAIWADEVINLLEQDENREDAWKEVNVAGFSEKSTTKFIEKYYERCLRKQGNGKDRKSRD